MVGLSSLPKAQTTRMPRKIAVIGVGTVGRRHLRVLRTLQLSQSAHPAPTLTETFVTSLALRKPCAAIIASAWA